MERPTESGNDVHAPARHGTVDSHGETTILATLTAPEAALLDTGTLSGAVNVARMVVSPCESTVP